MKNVTNFSELGAIDGGGDMGVFNTEQENYEIENAISPVSAAQGASNLPPKIPEWHTTLKREVDELKVKVDNMGRTMEQGFAGINAKLDKLSSTSQQTDTRQETGADSWQRVYNP